MDSLQGSADRKLVSSNTTNARPLVVQPVMEKEPASTGRHAGNRDQVYVNVVEHWAAPAAPLPRITPFPCMNPSPVAVPATPKSNTRDDALAQGTVPNLATTSEGNLVKSA